MDLQIEKLLKEKGVEYRLIKLSQKAYTVADVVKYSEGDINPEEICKTIILHGKRSRGSGNHRYGLMFRAEDLAKAVEYKVVNLTKTSVE